MGLLKTVFEVNLGLFGKKAKDGLVHLSCRRYFQSNGLLLARADELCCSS